MPSRLSSAVSVWVLECAGAILVWTILPPCGTMVSNYVGHFFSKGECLALCVLLPSALPWQMSPEGTDLPLLLCVETESRTSVSLTDESHPSYHSRHVSGRACGQQQQQILVTCDLSGRQSPRGLRPLACQRPKGCGLLPSSLEKKFIFAISEFGTMCFVSNSWIEQTWDDWFGWFFFLTTLWTIG